MPGYYPAGPAYSYGYPPPLVTRGAYPANPPRPRPPPAVIESMTSSQTDSDSESWQSAQETISDEDEVSELDNLGRRSTTRLTHSLELRANSRADRLDSEEPHPRRRGDSPEVSTNLDTFGRSQRHPDKSGTDFKKIIPDNPFAIIRGPFSEDQQKDDHANVMPILQFFTWQTWLYVRRTQRTGLPTPNGGLARYDIIDKAGDWCGSIVLSGNNEDAATLQGASQSFIAISDAKAFTREECQTWNYYIPKERDESDWDLYFVLLLQHNPSRGVWERAGLGKAFKAAFTPLVARWEEIKLG